MTDKKKDLTSIVDLANLQPAEGAATTDAADPSEFMQLPEIEKVSADDFKDLDQSLVPEFELSSDDSQIINKDKLAADFAEPQPATDSLDLNPATEPGLEVAAPAQDMQLEVTPAPVLPEITGGLDLAVSEEFTNTSPIVDVPKAVTTPPDLSDVKKFGETVAIGQPRVEANPPYSLMASGQFDEKKRDLITGIITKEDLGIRPDDLEIQLVSGKIFVPQISEFAAVTLAQKLRDLVDNIEIGPASQIFESESLKDGFAQPLNFTDSTHSENHMEESTDLLAEPESADQVFSSNLPQVQGFEVVRMLSAISVSEVVAEDVVQNRTGQDFESLTERLTSELASKAFTIGAHGVLGVSFNIKPVGGGKHIVVAMGSAVRVRKTKG